MAQREDFLKRRLALIKRRQARRIKRLSADAKLPDEIADETVEVVTPDAELEVLPDPD